MYGHRAPPRSARETEASTATPAATAEARLGRNYKSADRGRVRHWRDPPRLPRAACGRWIRDSGRDRPAEGHRARAHERHVPEDHPRALPCAGRREGRAHVVGLASEAADRRPDPGCPVHPRALFGSELRTGVERPIVVAPTELAGGLSIPRFANLCTSPRS